jgi:hypothetical protein
MRRDKPLLKRIVHRRPKSNELRSFDSSNDKANNFSSINKLRYY